MLFLNRAAFIKKVRIVQLSLYDLIWTIINFLIMVFVLYKLLYNPVLQILDARKKEIQQNYDRAELAKAEALQLKEEYTAAMQDSRQEAQEIITGAKKLAETSREEIIQEAKQEALRLTKKAREEINQEKDRAKAELRDEVSALAVMAAGKVLEKTLRAEDHEQMIRQFVQEVGDKS
jgi:F-type H+-transporting ATPase subunit b